MRPHHLVLGFFLFIFSMVLPVWLIFPTAMMVINNQLNLPIIYHPLLQLAAFFVATGGLFLILKTFSSFYRLGKGTPAPIQPPKKVVAAEMYQLTRNPMYLGYLLIFLGEFLFFGHLMLLVYTLFCFAVLHVYVIKIEEPILKQRFGKSYLNYCKKVPRWF